MFNVNGIQYFSIHVELTWLLGWQPIRLFSCKIILLTSTVATSQALKTHAMVFFNPPPLKGKRTCQQRNKIICKHRRSCEHCLHFQYVESRWPSGRVRESVISRELEINQKIYDFFTKFHPNKLCVCLVTNFSHSLSVSRMKPMLSYRQLILCSFWGERRVCLLSQMSPVTENMLLTGMHLHTCWEIVKRVVWESDNFCQVPSRREEGSVNWIIRLKVRITHVVRQLALSFNPIVVTLVVEMLFFSSQSTFCRALIFLFATALN